MKYSFVLWDKTLLPIEFGNYGLGGSVLVIINNILVSIFGTFFEKSTAQISINTQSWKSGLVEDFGELWGANVAPTRCF